MIMAKTIFVFSTNAKASEFFQSLTLVLIRCKLTNQLALLHWETFFFFEMLLLLAAALQAAAETFHV